MREIRRALALGFLASLACAACQSEPPGPADRLVDNWIEAAGGLDAWRDVESVRYTVTTVWFDSTGTPVRRRPRFVWGKKHPLRARIERDEPEGHYVQATDGEGDVWATLDGELLSDTTKAVREVLYVTGDVMYWIGLPYKLRDPGVNLRHIPKDSIGYEGVAVTFGEDVGLHPDDRWFYYFEEGSPFPVEVHYIEEGYTEPTRTRWSDYREAGPITYVGTRTFYDERGVTRKQLLISDVQINPELPDSLFTPPGT
ncbi:MAG: hypothetical protein GWN99_09780 [Gemmatimonadetes bacterium]|uniref:Outer membrane lipoprotein-sorting protein n=1 Tax=Candidatus Kutchimonas denitrificans TaxID=3056748 RepID=A0AAE4Z7K6_9BACT|nr:hypothetical protein [Gemmatimonadota bacterium]NIR74157.1 hypothetical protein [Candidatus Kutchimonas denitrificans]NIS01339.1 hypothetical protein [Gemmatimonadota bacterium]NIT67070.1 hypothetical protein [Gemmatimonadota bacterium]NIU51730.1 hypothetical protein [Gemmatimonadota bacterium]